LILTRQVKEELVIKLAKEGGTIREIAKAARISLLDIEKIIRRFMGKETEYHIKSSSVTSRAFQMFKEKAELMLLLLLIWNQHTLLPYLKVMCVY
jgi:hypothetical protein